MNKNIPQTLKLRKSSRLLEISFANDESFQLPFEYLRVFSPSAEVRGHTAQGVNGQFTNMQWPLNKQMVDIDKVVPVGNYAVQFWFSDGHNTGLYTWDVLYDLSVNHSAYWAEHLKQTKQS